MTSTSIPEQGQLVEVRQRHYVVTDVRQSTLPPEPLAQADATPQHRVTLASVEDDALGEELQVIWEIEPDTQVCEDLILLRPDWYADIACILCA